MKNIGKIMISAATILVGGMGIGYEAGIRDGMEQRRIIITPSIYESSETNFGEPNYAPGLDLDKYFQELHELEEERRNFIPPAS